MQKIEGRLRSTQDEPEVFAAPLQEGEEAPTRYQIRCAKSGIILCEITYQKGAPGELWNGVLDASLLRVVQDRMTHFQDSRLSGRYGALALTCVEQALLWMHARVDERKRAGVFKTDKPVDKS